VRGILIRLHNWAGEKLYGTGWPRCIIVVVPIYKWNERVFTEDPEVMN
jgi:hypothetical protein